MKTLIFLFIVKTFIFFSILFCALAVPALAELTDADLDKIRLIVKDEVKREIVSSETRMKEYINIKIAGVEKRIEGVEKRVADVEKRIEGVEKRVADVEKRVADVEKRIEGVDQGITLLTNFVFALIALIVAAIAIPQIILTWRSSKNREQEKINQELREEIEKLKQQQIVRP